MDNNETPKKSTRQLADEGDEAAKHYIEWAKLEKRKQDILTKLSMTAGVDPKYRDPEFTKAQAEYYGSAPDLARRTLETASLPGNIAKALIASPKEGGNRGQQVVSALKAVAGKPEDAFRENLTKGSDVAQGLGVSPENQELAGTAIDLTADIAIPLGIAAVGKGIGRSGSAMASLASKAAAKGEQAIAARIPKATDVIGDIKDLPAVARSADDMAEQATMFRSIDDQTAAKKAFDTANPVIPETSISTKLVEEVDNVPRSGLDAMDIPEIAPPVMPEQLSNAKVALDRMKKLSDEAALTRYRDSVKPPTTSPQMSLPAGPSQNQLKLPQAASEAALEAEVAAWNTAKNTPTTILQPGQPMNTAKLLEGIQKYGNPDIAQQLAKRKSDIKALLEKSQEAAKKVAPKKMEAKTSATKEAMKAKMKKEKK